MCTWSDDYDVMNCICEYFVGYQTHISSLVKGKLASLNSGFME